MINPQEPAVPESAPRARSWNCEHGFHGCAWDACICWCHPPAEPVEAQRDYRRPSSDSTNHDTGVLALVDSEELGIEVEDEGAPPAVEALTMNWIRYEVDVPGHGKIPFHVPPDVVAAIRKEATAAPEAEIQHWRDVLRTTTDSWIAALDSAEAELSRARARAKAAERLVKSLHAAGEVDGRNALIARAKAAEGALREAVRAITEDVWPEPDLTALTQPSWQYAIDRWRALTSESVTPGAEG